MSESHTVAGVGRRSFWEHVAAKSWTMFATIVGVGTVSGLFAGWTVLEVDATAYNLHATIWLFLVVWSATTAYLFTERVPSGVLGTGLYVMALFVALKPAVLLGTVLLRDSGADPWPLVESLGGALVWSVVAVLLAVVTAAVGNFFNRRARRSVLHRTRRELRRRR